MGISVVHPPMSQLPVPASMADALFTATQQRVLALLFGQPDRSFFTKELIDLAGGGYGAILMWGKTHKEISAGYRHTTNNRMELMAAISALNALKSPCEVDLYTDSAYVKDGITKWIFGWKKKGWKTADNKPVKNVELWQALEAAQQRHKVTLHWVKGHAGHPENERADELARKGMEPFKRR